MHGTPEYNYNFFHSSSRISVECAFGEIDLCWGIFWRPLKFSLKPNCNIIDAAMHLHNFIVDFCEEMKDVTMSDVIEQELFCDDCRRFLAVNPDIDDGGVYGGEDDVRMDEDGNPITGGRLLKAESESKKSGINFREKSEMIST